MCDINGASTGAMICLHAIGKQDDHLISNDEKARSLFTYKEKRHSNFSKYHRTTPVINPGGKATWPFGETIKISMNPQNMGDLLSNMYISIKMPKIDGAPGNGQNYADQLGRHLFKSITMRVDELELETIYDDWMVLYDELYMEMSEKITNKILINRGIPYDGAVDNGAYAQYDTDLIIPLPFFFSRKYSGDEYDTNQPNRPFFPLCAIHKQKLEFTFVLHPQTFFTDSSTTISVPEFDIITEELTIAPEERIYYMKEATQLITDVVKKHPTMETEVGKDQVKLQLVPNIPVKCIHWFLRNKDFENVEVAQGPGVDSSYLASYEIPGSISADYHYFQNRFNFGSILDFDQLYSFFYPVMDKAKFYINGQDTPNITDANHSYYKYLTTIRARLSRPYRNVYTYSFSMYPMNVKPSGSLDFSQLKSDKTNLEVNLKSGLTDTYTLHLYYTGYQTFKFSGGFISLAY